MMAAEKEAPPLATASAPESTFVVGPSRQTISESNLNPNELITDEASAPPFDFPSLSQIAKKIAKEYQVSLRTAYRHLARKSVPSLVRCIGRDGKTYPRHPLGYILRTPVKRELTRTRQALNRANAKADMDGIHDADIALLRHIVLSAQEILGRWEIFE